LILHPNAKPKNLQELEEKLRQVIGEFSQNYESTYGEIEVNFIANGPYLDKCIVKARKNDKVTYV
jgi:hypothetical protein